MVANLFLIFCRSPVLLGLDMNVERGQIYGLLGKLDNLTNVKGGHYSSLVTHWLLGPGDHDK